MRFRVFPSFLLVAVLVAPAWASFGSGPGDKPSESSAQDVPTVSSQATARQEAEKWYADAYDDVAKAKQEAVAGKADRAAKRYRKALERGQRAVELDSTYHEAWNLVGYSARQLKEYDRALAAYHKCLAIRPDYAPAREYLGEAYLELGRPDQARAQLAWLEKAESERATLQKALDAWLAAHPRPQVESAKEAASAAPGDSASAANPHRKP